MNIYSDYLAIEYIVIIKCKIVLGRVRPTLVFSTVYMSCGRVVLDSAAFTNIHIVILAESEQFCQERCVALLSLFPGFRLHVSSIVHRDDLFPFLELEARSIKFENSHNSATCQDTLLQVTVLLAIQIFLALWRQVVRHMLRQVHQIGLEITRTSIDDPVDQESQELFLRRAASSSTACRTNHLFGSIYN